MATTASPHDPRLVGTWRREGAAPAGAEQNAARLELQAGGLYRGEATVPGEFTWWDAGTWRVKQPGVLSLSLANDEVVDYAFELRGDSLSITDKGGRRVVYRRSP